ncbi:MAG: type IX secretion system membrane protein PorP/SprF [Bacteroidales bacterium]|jgi:type IX secretion system PorP/SprF family membrane protein|nr:type IX secretion system membrane protein PorP/SprF [Bacteroidales bacterium]MBR3577287.1 type IX secretion system membrane protein PorP/SprF [Bacteroidales bacterium]MBR4646935.1 type IX secretion system membrane protein PorP/SprF [Bacteroidales bacterium]
MKKIICVMGLLLLALVSGTKVSAQDPHFSQFYANPLYLNPAFAGTNVCPRITAHFRDQWPNIHGTYLTYSASYDQHFDKLAGGIGVLFMGDHQGQGTINTYAASIIYSYKLKVTRKFSMRFALQATFQQKSLNWDKLTFGDMIDPKYGFVYETNETAPAKQSKAIADFSAGFIGYTKNFYFGLAVNHVTRPYEGFISVSRLPIKWTAHVGGYFDLKRRSRKSRSFGDISISPNIIYQHQMEFHQLNYGFYLNYYPFAVGIWYRQSFRNPDAVIFMFGLQHERVRVAYSYDLTVSKLANLSGGAHEVSLQLLLPCPERKRVMKDLVCPTF